MARLTRTQKYADLRDRIAQDREESLRTERLSQYENKLKNFENYFNNVPETNLERKVEIKPIVEPAVETKPQVDEVQLEKLRSLDDILNSMMEQTSVFSNEEPVEEPKDETITIETVEDKTVEPVEEPKDEITPFNGFDLKTEEEKIEPVEISNIETVEEKVVEPVVLDKHEALPSPLDDMSTMELVLAEVEELSSIIEKDEPKDVAPVVNNEPVEENKESTNSFIDETLKEVDEYNRNEGRTTLNELPDSFVEEVRHPQTETKEEKEVEEDLDFSNTVSLEIDKVLSEIKAQQEAMKADVETNTAVYNEAELVAQEAFENVEIKEEEHPVLTKAIEEPVVEIKNITETLNNTFTNVDVLDDTIPFVVEKTDEDEDEYDDYDEDETPSKVLNVILGVLIFVLVAVLGVIVYYILLAKGIIG